MDKTQVVSLLQSLFMFAFLWGMNLSLGMSFTVAQVLAPFKRWGVILLAVGLNAIVIPLLWWGLSRLLPMNSEFATGFLLLGFASAAPFGIKAAIIEKGDVPLGVGLVIVLGLLNVLAIPLWSALLMPAGVTINPGQIATTLVLLVLAPLIAGLAIRARYPEHANALTPGASRISNLALALLLALMVAANFQSILNLIGSWVIVGAVIAMALSMLLGYLIGGDRASRRVTLTTSAMRSAGSAVAISTQAFANQPDVTVAVMVLSLVTLLPLIVASEWGRRAAIPAPGESQELASAPRAEPAASMSTPKSSGEAIA